MIALLNPRNARWKYRFPLSLMFIGAFLEDKYSYEILDQNLRPDVLDRLDRLAERREIKYLGVTVMPGPQLFEAIPISKYLKEKHPELTIIWGGYFASLHSTTVLESGYVDFVIRGQGERSFVELIDALEGNSQQSLKDIGGLSYRDGARIIQNPFGAPIDPNLRPPLPYDRIDGQQYVGKTYLGSRTAGYYSSVGCPFLCGFCAVASIYQARWLPMAPERVVNDLEELKARYQVNAIEFFDENFFTSEKRVYELSERLIGRNFQWWGEGRPDTMLDYSNETLSLMRKAGCKMIFYGAESGDEEVLQRMNKGGTQTPDTVLQLAERLKHFDIVPEFSFVFGSPGADVERDFERNVRFIRKLKEINPRAEIIVYMYAPVAFSESELLHLARQYGFRFPTSLDGWLAPEWRNFDLRKTPAVPWLTPQNYRRFRDFERVLNGYYPTVTDLKLTERGRAVMRALSAWRYKLSIYGLPMEIRLMQRLLRYRQPEIEGL
jgi:radical SAM superfamily enzyme YgiQ (UPF0313 family)